MQNAVLACAAPTARAAEAVAARGGGDGVGGGSGGDVVKVKRSTLAACLTCPLCGRLIRDAATITECLHTFCRKCISEEFINKEVCCCPTCNIDLGCAPEEKLRVDHSLQYIRSKIFPSKRRKIEDQEAISPITSPVKKKERSLSSLTVHAPRVSIQKYLTKRRTKASCLRSFSLGTKDKTKKVGGWKPLGQLRVGKVRNSFKTGSEDVNRTSREHLTRRVSLVKKNGSRKVFTLKGKKKRFKAKHPSKQRRLRSLWFCLVAAFDQLEHHTLQDFLYFQGKHRNHAFVFFRKGQPPLPQLPTKFLRIKDVNLPASFIQKYLVQKLGLWSETEVEMMCSGKKVNPAMTLHDLADCWLDKGPKGRMRTSVGSPATGLIATLFYGRPELPPPPPSPAAPCLNQCGAASLDSSV